ncbi:MAG: hypothetical protein KJ737_16840 [Proteobacteria bacterium]|nr:hypothetical protein [Pseudomonadota bacterium]
MSYNLQISPHGLQIAETRLWNQKMNNESITMSQIVSELIHLFGIRLAPRMQEQLEAKIKQIRSRIYKRHNRLLRA